MYSSPPMSLSLHEQSALLDYLRRPLDSPFHRWIQLRNFTICLTLLDSGLRVGELCSLSWCSLFYNSRPVTSISISVSNSKTNHSRQIPVSDRLREALIRYHEQSITIAFPFHHIPAFFTSPFCRAITTRQVQRIISKASLESIGRPITPHVLRHTFATRLMGITDMRTVQTLLGHKHLSSTQIYTHPSSDDMRKAVNSASCLEHS